MAALRLELEITTVEPSGTMVFVEGQAPGGVQVGLMLPAGTLATRVGQRLAVSVETLNAASAPSMRERMARTETPRSAASGTAATAAAPGSTSADMTDVVLAAVFGTSPAAERERDVNEEMDALFGRRR
ncbi:hypothetical protein SAMN02745121_09182 [Nannocystis exedens]|uniref:Uncharacterized protein n=1 Tax=Nannocystis exedens TaxID=54 RepID=A0A1I2J450_9BACT|nr:hypothetical protein [Nannocystis exedens]PCC69313.1 hypothetical protein NAEX_02335 [Nannocystis exedens]SFF49522.1 hypothetical protein SAMN02745121_09182 [Nannocystis exedens]